MTRLGIYSVDSTELTKPPAERAYEQRGAYDLSKQQWSENTDERIQCVLPDGEKEYAPDEIRATLEGATTQVFFENQVPGDVTEAPVMTRCSWSASD